MTHILQFRSNILNSASDLDESSTSLIRRNKGNSRIKGFHGFFCLSSRCCCCNFLLFSSSLTRNKEFLKISNVLNSFTKLFLSIGEKAISVIFTFLWYDPLFLVMCYFSGVFWKKLIALSSLHVMGFVSCRLFASDRFRKFIDKFEDITNHSVSSEVQL